MTTKRTTLLSLVLLLFPITLSAQAITQYACAPQGYFFYLILHPRYGYVMQSRQCADVSGGTIASVTGDELLFSGGLLDGWRGSEVLHLEGARGLTLYREVADRIFSARRMRCELVLQQDMACR